MAQAPKAPKAKTGKAATAGKDANKKSGSSRRPPPKAGKPGPDGRSPKPERKDSYIHVPVDEALKKLAARMRQDVFQCMKAGKYEEGQQANLQTYYRKLILPSWTQEENYYMLPKMRADLRNELRQGRNGPPHSDAQEILIGAMTRISNENFHPAVRYNAMLALGDLNEQEPVGFNGVPTPLPEVVPLLINALTDDKQIDAVKVAALVGLIRHARLGIADQQLVTQKLVPALVKLAEEKTPPAARSADGHEWMRYMAIDLLGLLRSVGNKNEVAKTLSTIVADKKDVPERTGKEMLVRCAAARALGNLDYANVSGLNPASMAEGLAGLALDACGRETATSSSEEEGMPISRRRLRAQLYAVSVGFNGVDEQHKGIRGLAQNTPVKDYVEKLYGGVQALAIPFDMKDRKDTKLEIDDLELTKAIGLAATAITQMIEQRANGGAAPAENGAKPPADKPKEPAAKDAPSPAEAPKKPAEPKGF